MLSRCIGALHHRWGIDADALTALFVARFRALAKDLYEPSTYLSATDKILPALAEAASTLPFARPYSMIG